MRSDFGGHCCKSSFKLIEFIRKVLFCELLKRFSMQETWPENGTGQISNLVPFPAGRNCSAHDTAHAGAGDDDRFNLKFIQDLDDTNMREAANRASTQRQTDSVCSQ
jgi:hypothetical protein